MHLVVYLLKALSFLPLPVLYAVSNILAPLLEYVFRYRIVVVDENLRNAFPEKSPKDRSSIRHRYYSYLADLIVETLKLHSMSAESLKKRVRFAQPDLLAELGSAGNNVIIMMGHSGNWEWAGVTTELLYEARILPVYRKIKSEPFDRFYYQLRSRFGSKPVLDKEIMQMIGQQEERHIVAMLADQTPSPKKAIWLDFLHQDTPFFRGTEILAQRSNHAIVFAHVNRLSRGNYEIQLEQLSEDNKGRVTIAFAEFLERQIHAQPYNWLWSHKRWKHKRKKD